MDTKVKQYEVKSIVVTNGEAFVVNKCNERINYPVSILQDDKIIIPPKAIDLSRITTVLINCGTIYFEDNKALLNFSSHEYQNKSVMWQLGKAAEAIIVKRCAESEKVRYRMFCIATGKKARKETARQFEACGTSLIDTRIYHKWHYNPNDTQRDILFINSAGKVAFMSNATSMAGECAGLQVKTSHEIINYVFIDIITKRYCVPIICFPLMDIKNPIWNPQNFEEIIGVNIYDILIRKICGNKKRRDEFVKNHLEYFSDHLSTERSFINRLEELLRKIIIDINDIDKVAFQELLYVKDLLKLLAQRRITPDDLIRQSNTLKSVLLSEGLHIYSHSVQTNNILMV